MLREMCDALEVLTATQPLLLVLEDLQWSDTATLAWLVAVARRPDPARLLVTGTYRPMDVITQAHPLRGLVQELRALEIFRKYEDQLFSIADCASFVVARDRRIREVFGFDRNFLTMGFILNPGPSVRTRRHTEF